MAKIRPDFSFEREGRPLSAWLLDLVADQASARIKAGDVLHGMWFGVPYAHTNLAEVDWEEFHRQPDQPARFGEAARQAVAAPGFPASAFARRLIIAVLVKQHDWRRFRRKSRERAAVERDEVVEGIVRRLLDAGDPPGREPENRRIAVKLCPGLDGRSDAHLQQAVDQAGFAVHLVSRVLDTAFLTDRPGLRAWLDLDVLRRIGPPAIDFAPSLLDRLDAGGDRHAFNEASALGSIGRDDPAVVAALLGRLASGPPPMQSRVAGCLMEAGPTLAGRVDEAVGLLIKLAASPGEACLYTVVEALASVGRDRDDAFEVLLQMASPRPPHLVPDRYFPDRVRDMTMFERGIALTALRFFPRFAGRAAPVLIEAMSSFEEYDPDWQYDGAHGRIGHTLAAYGPEAEAAVPHLAAYLEDYLRQCRATLENTADWPKAVFRALAAIGPAAADALPILEAIRRDREAEDESGEPSPLDPSDDLDRAILAIRR